MNTDHKINFVELSKYLYKGLKLVAKNIKIFCSSLFLRFQQNYFAGSTKLFLDLYPAKF